MPCCCSALAKSAMPVLSDTLIRANAPRDADGVFIVVAQYLPLFTGMSYRINLERKVLRVMPRIFAVCDWLPLV